MFLNKQPSFLMGEEIESEFRRMTMCSVSNPSTDSGCVLLAYTDC